jgi:hypothetical protein
VWRINASGAAGNPVGWQQPLSTPRQVTTSAVLPPAPLVLARRLRRGPRAPLSLLRLLGHLQVELAFRDMVRRKPGLTSGPQSGNVRLHASCRSSRQSDQVAFEYRHGCLEI